MGNTKWNRGPAEQQSDSEAKLFSSSSSSDFLPVREPYLVTAAWRIVVVGFLSVIEAQ